MNILYLHRTQARGVEGVHVAEIVKAFRRLGHEVEIVSPVGDRLGESAAKPGAGGRRDGLYAWVSRHVPEVLFELAELAYNAQALWQARHARGKVDLLFERYAIFAVAGAWLSRWWARPLVVEVNYTSSSHLVRRRSRLLAPLARRLDRYVFTRAAGLTVVSSELRRHLIEAYGVAPHKIVLVPNAADPEVFDPARIAAHRTAGRVIGFVGGFYPWHGLDVLVEAFRLVSERVADARLLLIGDGPMMPAIRARVAALGLEDRVTLTGWVDHAELPAHIASFHVGVMPDSNDYGSPMKIFEYMAMNKPVVVPDYPPLRDVVTDGAEGRIFRPRDAQALAECLTMTLTDDAAHRRMAENARSKIVSTHNWRRNAEEILRAAFPRTA